MSKSLLTPQILALLLLLGAPAACGGDSEQLGGKAQALEQACFTTPGEILCMHAGAADQEKLRERVEDFYPSACMDGDADLDGIPDFLDYDSLDVDGQEDPFEADELRCPKCNRGPGTQNDFRLDIEGDALELDRGKVFSVSIEGIEVPTPDGVLMVHVDETTRYEDGEPGPGAEIRVEGRIDGPSSVLAERIKVLCPGAPAMDDDEVPESVEPPTDGDGPIIL